MIMHFKKYCSLILVTLLSFSCQTIDEGERWLPLAKKNIQQYPILIEEYTGQKCINCPEAAELLHKIVQQSGVKHIIVAMHSPYSGLTLPTLASDEAQNYSEHFNHKRSVPGIMLNREVLSTGLYYDQNRPSWAALIQQMARQKPKYSLNFQASYGGVDKKIEVNLSSNLLDQSANPNVGLGLWLVEDVKAPQVTHKGVVADYQHHNVFRASLNGTWGEDYQIAQAYKKSFSLPSSVKAMQNAKLVAFLFDTKTKLILVSAIEEIQIHYKQ